MTLWQICFLSMTQDVGERGRYSEIAAEIWKLWCNYLPITQKDLNSLRRTLFWSRTVGRRAGCNSLSMMLMEIG